MSVEDIQFAEFQKHWAMAMEEVGAIYFGTEEPSYVVPRPNFTMIERRSWASHPSGRNAMLRIMIGLMTSGGHSQSGTIEDYSYLLNTEFAQMARVMMAYYHPAYFDLKR